MRARLRPLIGCILMVVAAQAASLQELPIPGIQGDDDRLLVKGADYPWGAIGRLNNTLGPFCTGTLIGPRRVLTAAHCLWNRRTRTWLPTCVLYFLAGYRPGGHLAHSLVVSYELAVGAAMPQKGPSSTPARDWAVLTLAEDLSAVAKPLPTLNLDPDLLVSYRQQGVFLQAGYSRDRPHILTLNRPCRIIGFARDGRVALHACDATFGDSGSPWLLERDGQYHIVAMLVGIDNKTRRGIAVTGKAFHDAVRKLAPPVPTKPTFKACETPTTVQHGLAMK